MSTGPDTAIFEQPGDAPEPEPDGATPQHEPETQTLSSSPAALQKSKNSPYRHRRRSNSSRGSTLDPLPGLQEDAVWESGPGQDEPAVAGSEETNPIDNPPAPWPPAAPPNTTSSPAPPVPQPPPTPSGAIAAPAPPAAAAPHAPPPPPPPGAVAPPGVPPGAAAPPRPPPAGDSPPVAPPGGAPSVFVAAPNLPPGAGQPPLPPGPPPGAAAPPAAPPAPVASPAPPGPPGGVALPAPPGGGASPGAVGAFVAPPPGPPPVAAAVPSCAPPGGVALPGPPTGAVLPGPLASFPSGVVAPPGLPPSIGLSIPPPSAAAPPGNAPPAPPPASVEPASAAGLTSPANPSPPQLPAPEQPPVNQHGPAPPPPSKQAPSSHGVAAPMHPKEVTQPAPPTPNPAAPLPPPPQVPPTPVETLPHPPPTPKESAPLTTAVPSPRTSGSLAPLKPSVPPASPVTQAPPTSAGVTAAQPPPAPTPSPPSSLPEAGPSQPSAPTKSGAPAMAPTAPVLPISSGGADVFGALACFGDSSAPKLPTAPPLPPPSGGTSDEAPPPSAPVAAATPPGPLPPPSAPLPASLPVKSAQLEPLAAPMAVDSSLQKAAPKLSPLAPLESGAKQLSHDKITKGTDKLGEMPAGSKMKMAPIPSEGSHVFDAFAAFGDSTPSGKQGGLKPLGSSSTASGMPEEGHPNSPTPKPDFHLGQSVVCRNGAEQWKEGEITSISPLKVKRKGDLFGFAHVYDEVQPKVLKHSGCLEDEGLLKPELRHSNCLEGEALGPSLRHSNAMEFTEGGWAPEPSEPGEMMPELRHSNAMEFTDDGWAPAEKVSADSEPGGGLGTVVDEAGPPPPPSQAIDAGSVGAPPAPPSITVIAKQQFEADLRGIIPQGQELFRRLSPGAGGAGAADPTPWLLRWLLQRAGGLGIAVDMAILEAAWPPENRSGIGSGPDEFCNVHLPQIVESLLAALGSDIVAQAPLLPPSLPTWLEEWAAASAAVGAPAAANGEKLIVPESVVKTSFIESPHLEQKRATTKITSALQTLLQDPAVLASTADALSQRHRMGAASRGSALEGMVSAAAVPETILQLWRHMADLGVAVDGSMLQLEWHQEAWLAVHGVKTPGPVGRSANQGCITIAEFRATLVPRIIRMMIAAAQRLGQNGMSELVPVEKPPAWLEQWSAKASSDFAEAVETASTQPQHALASEAAHSLQLADFSPLMRRSQQIQQESIGYPPQNPASSMSMQHLAASAPAVPHRPGQQILGAATIPRATATLQQSAPLVMGVIGVEEHILPELVREVATKLAEQARRNWTEAGSNRQGKAALPTGRILLECARHLFLRRFNTNLMMWRVMAPGGKSSVGIADLAHALLRADSINLPHTVLLALWASALEAAVASDPDSALKGRPGRGGVDVSGVVASARLDFAAFIRAFAPSAANRRERQRGRSVAGSDGKEGMSKTTSWTRSTSRDQSRRWTTADAPTLEQDLHSDFTAALMEEAQGLDATTFRRAVSAGLSRECASRLNHLRARRTVVMKSCPVKPLNSGTASQERNDDQGQLHDANLSLAELMHEWHEIQAFAGFFGLSVNVPASKANKDFKLEDIGLEIEAATAHRTVDRFVNGTLDYVEDAFDRSLVAKVTPGSFAAKKGVEVGSNIVSIGQRSQNYDPVCARWGTKDDVITPEKTVLNAPVRLVAFVPPAHREGGEAVKELMAAARPGGQVQTFSEAVRRRCCLPSAKCKYSMAQISVMWESISAHWQPENFHVTRFQVSRALNNSGFPMDEHVVDCLFKLAQETAHITVAQAERRSAGTSGTSAFRSLRCVSESRNLSGAGAADASNMESTLHPESLCERSTSSISEKVDPQSEASAVPIGRSRRSSWEDPSKCPQCTHCQGWGHTAAHPHLVDDAQARCHYKLRAGWKGWGLHKNKCGGHGHSAFQCPGRLVDAELLHKGQPHDADILSEVLCKEYPGGNAEIARASGKGCPKCFGIDFSGSAKTHRHPHFQRFLAHHGPCRACGGIGHWWRGCPHGLVDSVDLHDFARLRSIFLSDVLRVVGQL